MLVKSIGRDCELSTTGINGNGRSIDASIVTRAVLEQIKAVFQDHGATVWSRSDRFHSSSLDCWRRWVSNGSCFYADMSHVECCTPSCVDPLDFAAYSWHLAVAAEEARKRAQSQKSDGTVYSLSTSNADIMDPSISFGTHISVGLEHELWEDLILLHRRPARLATVSSALAAAIPFFGAGYLLPMKDRTVYSLSARAHHISRICSQTTTQAFHRGMLNARREAHSDACERLHIIGFDYCLPSSPLLCSFLQCLFAAVEEDYCSLQLYDPVRSLKTWSWGLDLQTGQLPHTANLVDGRQLTLPEYLRELTQVLLRMCESGMIPEHVAPRAQEMLPRIIDLTHYAEEGAIDQCARHLTWAAKILCLLNLVEQSGGTLGDAESRLADHDFSNTDPRRGVLWELWNSDLLDPLVSHDDIEACWRSAPEYSRDYGRGKLIERLCHSITDVDWSYVEIRQSADLWSPRTRVNFPRLNTLNRREFDHIASQSSNVNELIAALGAAASQSDPLERVTDHLAIPGNLYLES